MQKGCHFFDALSGRNHFVTYSVKQPAKIREVIVIQVVTT